eukprot:334318-Amphidinium_carterae.2
MSMRTHADSESAAGERRSEDMSSQPSTSSLVSPSGRGQAQAGCASIPDEERNAFLAQFPMASRTERQLRNRMEETRKRAGAPSAAELLPDVGSPSSPEHEAELESQAVLVPSSPTYSSREGIEHLSSLPPPAPQPQLPRAQASTASEFE